eukprot:2077959-Pleurochrysis_carterae.AAC.1
MCVCVQVSMYECPSSARERSCAAAVPPPDAAIRAASRLGEAEARHVDQVEAIVAKLVDQEVVVLLRLACRMQTAT